MSIITIANETGCGEVMYTYIAKTLQYKLVNREMMSYVASLMGLDEKDISNMDEKKHSRWNLFLNMFTYSNEPKDKGPAMSYVYDNTPNGENFKYTTEKVIRMLANKGNVIVVGRGSNLILKDMPNVFHVYLCANEQIRATNISKSMNISYKDAVKYAQETDSRKQNFIKYYYDSDMTDMHNYHMVFNLSLISEEDAAKIVCSIVNE